MNRVVYEPRKSKRKTAVKKKNLENFTEWK
jgi:hypothetical protein